MPTTLGYLGAGVDHTAAFATARTTALADDKVVNGAFTADTNWTKGSGWDINTSTAGKAHGAAGVESDLTATVAPLTSGITYLVTFTISAYGAGSVFAKLGTQVGNVRSGNGTYKQRITANGTGLALTKSADFVGDIDNFSVVDANIIIPAAAGPWTFSNAAGNGTGVPRYAMTMADYLDLQIDGDLLGDPTRFLGSRDCMIGADKFTGFHIHGTGTVRMGGVTQFGTYTNPVAPYNTNSIVNGTFAADTDWTKGAGFTISGGAAHAAAGSASDLSAIVAPLTSGVTYLVTFTISNYVAGTLTAKCGTAAGTARSANGTFSELITANGTGFLFSKSAAFAGDIDNVTAIGAGPGGPEEHRHCLQIRGCSNFVVDGSLNFNGAGGDGIYVGMTESDLDSLWTPSTDYLISGATCNANLRQGCSVLSSRRGTIYRCKFTNTLGVSPQSGIDLEPERDNVNNIEGELSDVRLVECVAYGNASRDFFMNLERLGAATPTFHVTYQDCIAGKPDGAVDDTDGFDFVMSTGGPTAGRIDVIRCRAQNLNYRALRLKYRVDQGPQLRFVDFWSKDCARLTAEKAIVADFGSVAGSVKRIEFLNLRVSDRYDRAVISKVSAPTTCRELQGTILVDRIRRFLPGVAQTAGFPCLQYKDLAQLRRKGGRMIDLR